MNVIHRKAFLSVVTQETGYNAREIIFIEKHVEVSWLARAEQACVTVEIVIIFDWAHDIPVYDRARVAVPFLVTVGIGPREEDHLVFLGNDDKCDLGVKTHSCTCVCGSAVVRQGISLSLKHGEKVRDGLRINSSSFSRIVRNSPSETPS